MKALFKRFGATLAGLSLLMGLIPAGVIAFTPSNLVDIVSGSTTVDFGSVDRNETETKTVRVRNNTNRTVRASYVDEPKSPFNIDESRSEVVFSAGETGDIVFEVRSSVSGNFEDRVIVTFEDDSSNVKYEDISFRLEVDVDGNGSSNNGDFEISDTTVDFGSQRTNTSSGFTETVRLRNNYDRSVTFTIVEAVRSPFSYRVDGSRTIPANSYRDVEFSFRPTANRSYEDELEIRTSTTDNSRRYTIKVEGRGSSSGSSNNDFDLVEFTSGSERVDFGDVDVNETERKTVRIKNVSDRRIELTRIPSNVGPFRLSVSNADRVLERNEVADLEFTVRATSRRDYDERMRVTFSDVFSSRTDDIEFRLTADVDADNNTGDTDEDLIQDFYVYTDSDLYFNSPRAYVSVEFRVERSSAVDLNIYDQSGRLVERVFTNRLYSARNTVQTYNFTLADRLYANRGYRFELTAETSSTPARRDTDTYVIGNNGYNNDYNNGYFGQNYGSGCGGFVDVDPNSQFCDAVEFVADQGIFLGDSNGSYRTLRMNDTVNRAEAVAIMLRAIDASGSSDYPLPFYDVNERDWYADELRTAVELGAINGYPDGTFRPGQTMTRAEFYKAFVRLVDNRNRGNFFLNYSVNYRPFNDVTLNGTSRWYLPYADFARRYFDRSDFAARHFGTSNLGGQRGADANGYFKPGQAITRGHIIEFIYETHQRNVIDY